MGPIDFSPPCGPVHGRVDRDVRRATGIVYAVADRFQVPQPAPDTSDVIDATHWAAPCPQHEVPFLTRVLGDADAGVPPDEHCQRLSVTMPDVIEDGELLPVLVWIHGGSYTSGAGDAPIMDPYELVSEQRIIVVTVTYRLGLFGYLGDASDPAARPANLGLLDQIEAFRWVQRNIAAFGGDPAQVTAAGQSAGGDAVAHLMATPSATKLFQRAIIQSAPLGIARGRRSMNDAMAAAARRVTADMTADEVLAVEPDVAKAGGGFGLRSAMPFGTQYGLDPLPEEDRIEAAWNEVAPQIPVLIGQTAEEARMFVADVPAIRRAAAVPLLGPAFRRALVALVTDAVYGRPAARFARRHATAGGQVARYVIGWRTADSIYGAAHTVDLPLLFGDAETWRDAEIVAGFDPVDLERAGRRVRAIWADFVRGSMPIWGVPRTIAVRRVRARR